METIPLADCTKVGILQKPHGTGGEMLFHFDEKFMDSIEGTNLLFVKIDGLLVPFFINDNGLLIKSDKQALVKFKWIDSPEQAHELSGQEVYLKSENILNPNIHFSAEMLTGFSVFDSQKSKIGIITRINNYSGSFVLTVRGKGKEFLIPYSEELVEVIDVEKEILQIKIPEGLMGME